MPAFVSVLLPVYNGEKFVREAIESVLAQDYDHFEFIISDNASTDDTASIISEYCANPRVRIIHNTRTISRLENFNRVFDAASAESRWYKFIGDDDRLLPGCLEEMVQAGESGSNVGLVCSYYYNGDKLVTGAIPEALNLIKGPELLKLMLLVPGARSTIFSPAALLIKPEAYRKLGPFRTDLLHADAELFYRILNDYNLAYVHRPLVRIGFHAASGQALSESRGDSFSEAYLVRYLNLKRYNKISLSQLEIERIKHNLVLDSTGYMLARLLKRDPPAAYRHLKTIPVTALHHLPLSFLYFVLLTLKKLLRREPVKLLEKSIRPEKGAP